MHTTNDDEDTGDDDDDDKVDCEDEGVAEWARRKIRQVLRKTTIIIWL